LPNLLIADNDLKLITVYKNLKIDEKAVQAKTEGQLYLAESLKSVRRSGQFKSKKGLKMHR